MDKKSPSALRRQREKEHRLRTILNAAETLFVEKGYHQTGITEIANMAEVSVGTLYFYFKNKESLLIGLTDNIAYELRKIVGLAFQQADGTLDGFKKAGMAFFKDFCLPYPQKVAILFRESVGQSEEVEKRRKNMFFKLTLDVQNALLKVTEKMGKRFQGEISAEVMAVSIVGIYERVSYHYLLWRDENINIMDVGENAVNFLIGGVNALFLDKASVTSSP